LKACRTWKDLDSTINALMDQYSPSMPMDIRMVLINNAVKTMSVNSCPMQKLNLPYKLQARLTLDL
jgi:hypothetical protein